MAANRRLFTDPPLIPIVPGAPLLLDEVELLMVDVELVVPAPVPVVVVPVVEAVVDEDEARPVVLPVLPEVAAVVL
jgi:hypothetical protein